MFLKADAHFQLAGVHFVIVFSRSMLTFSLRTLISLMVLLRPMLTFSAVAPDLAYHSCSSLHAAAVFQLVAPNLAYHGLGCLNATFGLVNAHFVNVACA